MSKKIETIVLDTSHDRLVKRIALQTFKTGKCLARNAKQLPNAIKLAAVDVKQAWHESSIPNV